MAATFTLIIGGLNLSNYLRVNPDDESPMDPYSPHFVEPAWADTPFSDGQVLISTTVQNREQMWPLFLNSINGPAVTNLVPNPSPEYDVVGQVPAAWSASAPAWFLNTGATLTALAQAGAPVGSNVMQVVTTAALGLEGGAIPLGVLPAGTYNASVFVKGNAGGEALQLFAGIISPGTGDGTLNFTAATSFQRQSVTFTADGATACYVGVKTQAAAAVSFFLDAVMVSAGAALQPYGDGDQKSWLWSGAPGNSTSTSLVGRDGVNQLVRAINQACAVNPLILQWQDNGSSQSTYYNVAFVRFEPNYNFRRGVHGYVAGVLHVWTSGYGHTGTTRVTATAAGTGIFLSVPIGSIAGDAPALLDTTINVGAVVPSLGRIVAIAPITNPSYTPRIPAASLLSPQTNATLVGASGADGSQYLALPVSPTGGASGIACKVPLPNPTIAGGDNRILAVVQSGIDAGVAINALDPYGNSMGATAVASNSQGYALVDLGVCRLPTVGLPTQPQISILAGAIWASGGAGPNVLASPAALRINEIFCLPDKNLALVYERGGGGAVLSKDAFNGNGGINGTNDGLGNPWSQAYNYQPTLAGVLTRNVGGFLNENLATQGAIAAAHLAGVLTDSMLITVPAQLYLGKGECRLLKESATGAFVQARYSVGSAYLDLSAATSTTLNLIASIAASMADGNQVSLSARMIGGQVTVNLTRQDGGAITVAGASSAFASIGASSAAMSAAGMPGVALVQGNTGNSFPLLRGWEVDAIGSSNILPYDSYTIAGNSVDSYRTSSAGVFAGAKLVSVQKGAFPKMVPSTTSLAVICAPVDQGVANDVISAVVSVRERYVYSR